MKKKIIVKLLILMVMLDFVPAIDTNMPNLQSPICSVQFQYNKLIEIPRQVGEKKKATVKLNPQQLLP